MIIFIPTDGVNDHDEGEHPVLRYWSKKNGCLARTRRTTTQEGIDATGTSGKNA